MTKNEESSLKPSPSSRCRPVRELEGIFSFDPNNPDGSPRKWIRSERRNKLGCNAKVGLEQGLVRADTQFQKVDPDPKSVGKMAVPTFKIRIFC